MNKRRYLYCYNNEDSYGCLDVTPGCFYEVKMDDGTLLLTPDDGHVMRIHCYKRRNEFTIDSHEGWNGIFTEKFKLPLVFITKIIKHKIT
jgi:hypothetical protein